MKKTICVLFCLLFSVNQLTASAVFDAYTETVSYLTFSNPSSSGYSDIIWVDKNGKEIKKDESLHREKKGGVSAKSVLPRSYNSVNKQAVTSVKDQGVTGSCWAFAMMAVAESSLISSKIADKSSVDLSEAHHVWFTHKSYVEKNSADPVSGDGTDVSSPYQAGGNWLRSTFSLAKGSGFADESDYPFSPNNESLMGNYSESARYVSKYRLKNSYTISKDNMSALKERIMTAGALNAAMYMNSSYLNKTVGNYCYYYPSAASTNHQITIVGWDDDYSFSNFKSSCQPSGNGAWIIKNSYGSTWGNNGYFYLSYYDQTLKSINTVDVTDSKDISTVYQYDGYGYGTSVSANDAISGNKIKTAYMANVFKAEKSENISSVSFYTAADNCNYTVEIYTGLSKTYTNPTDGGKLVSSQSGTLPYEGYFTVDLKDLAGVKKDEYFSVVVNLTCEDGAYIPFEGQSNVDDGSYIRYYSSDSKQSYYHFGTSSAWKEASTTKYNNVCIKAFAKEADTVEITSAKELADFSKAVNDGNSFFGKTVKLMNDISVQSEDFEPIGTQSHPFDGIFDGNGKVISNLSVSATENAGLFGVTGENSVIKFLGLDNVNVNADKNAGALAGVSNSVKIYNCYANGTVTGKENAGGFIGINNSGITDNCYCTASVSSENEFGSFAGLDNSKYDNCYALSQGNPVIGKKSIDGISLSKKEQFQNGFVAYNLESDVMTWTKGKSAPVLSQSKDYEVYMVTVFNKSTSEILYVYLTQFEDIRTLIENEMPKKEVTVYSDYAAQNEFSGAVTFNRTLYITALDKGIIFKPLCTYYAENGMMFGIKQFTKVSDVLQNIENASKITVYDHLGNEANEDSFVTTGFAFTLKDENGKEIESLKVVMCGDLNFDGFIDAFDLSILSAAANFEFELDTNEALFAAGELTKDGFIDAFDTSILTAAVNYEIEL